MVSHEAVTAADPPEPEDGVTEQADERRPVQVIDEDDPPGGTARGKVVQAGGEGASDRSWHQVSKHTKLISIYQGL